MLRHMDPCSAADSYLLLVLMPIADSKTVPPAIVNTVMDSPRSRMPPRTPTNGMR